MKNKIDKVAQYVKFQFKFFKGTYKEIWDNYVPAEIKEGYTLKDVLDFFQLQEYVILEREEREYKRICGLSNPVEEKLQIATDLIEAQSNFIKKVYEMTAFEGMSTTDKRALLKSARDSLRD